MRIVWKHFKNAPFSVLRRPPLDMYGISGREITKYTVEYVVYTGFWPNPTYCLPLPVANSLVCQAPLYSCRFGASSHVFPHAHIVYVIYTGFWPISTYCLPLPVANSVVYEAPLYSCRFGASSHVFPHAHMRTFRVVPFNHFFKCPHTTCVDFCASDAYLHKYCLSILPSPLIR